MIASRQAAENDKRGSTLALNNELHQQAGPRFGKRKLTRIGLFSILGLIFVWLVLSALTLSRHGEPLDACSVRADLGTVGGKALFVGGPVIKCSYRLHSGSVVEEYLWLWSPTYTPPP